MPAVYEPGRMKTRGGDDLQHIGCPWAYGETQIKPRRQRTSLSRLFS